MRISIFSIWMTVLWSGILIVLFYVLRKKQILIDICSVSGVVVLYLFCLIRMLVPVEFSWTKVITAPELYNRIYDIFYHRINAGIGFYVYQLLLFVWLVVAVLLIFRMANQYIRIVRYYGSMEVTENQMISAVWKRLAIKKVPDIVQTAAVESPCCIGVLKKRIFIPEKTYSEDELYYILCHECVHLQNNDFLTKLLIHIICVFYWWNPFVYLLKKDLNQSMEIRCDSVVAEKLSRQQRSDYLSVMLKEFKEKQGMKGSEKDGDIAVYLLEDDSKKLIERFQLVADGKGHSFPKGKILAWLMAGFLLLVSYSFVIQTKYEAPPDEIETDSYAHEVDSGNSYIIKQGDGSYILHTAEQDIPISEESANQLVSDGFEMIYEEEMK